MVDHFLSTSTKNSDLKDSCSTPAQESDIQKPLCSLFDSHIKVPLIEKKSMSDQLK